MLSTATTPTTTTTIITIVIIIMTTTTPNQQAIPIMSRCPQNCFLELRNSSSRNTTSQIHAKSHLLSFVIWIVMEWQFCTLAAVQYWYSKNWKPRRPLFYNQVIHDSMILLWQHQMWRMKNESDHSFYNIFLLNIKGDSVFTFQLRIFFFNFSIFGFFSKSRRSSLRLLLLRSLPAPPKITTNGGGHEDDDDDGGDGGRQHCRLTICMHVIGWADK